MHWIDWTILFVTLLSISLYGVWKTRGSKDLESYLASDRSTPWWAIGLSIMATQASAITFISTPGMGYDQGLRFAQFYYGLPIALIIIAVFIAPRFFHLKVYTAYQFLEDRFNLNTRLFTAGLFLVQRGLAAGITIYAPSIILSEVLGWNLLINVWIIGILVILYTVSGGTKAVTQTHKHQMTIIFLGLFVAFGYLLYYLQAKTTLSTIIELASQNGMLNAAEFQFDLSDRYNMWSGIIGGSFLALSYFGTDQSQVQRYLSGKSLKEIRVGLYFNAVLKIPLQFFILFIGVLVFWFYTAYDKPLNFDEQKMNYLEQTDPELFNELNNSQISINALKDQAQLSASDMQLISEKQMVVDSLTEEAIHESDYIQKVKQTDFIFISWVLKWLPIGFIGLLVAVIFSAAMSSTSAELNALATTSMIDYYERLWGKQSDQSKKVRISKALTLLWGIIAIIFASVASLFDNLVEFVNILGSLFYGTILGVFLVALFIKQVKANAVLFAAIVAQVFIFCVHFFKDEIIESFDLDISFLWYNFIACFIVVVLSLLLENTVFRKR